MRYRCLPLTFGGILRVIGFAILSVLAGCASKPAPVFLPSERTRELPTVQQESITRLLARHFGTPLNPRLLAPTNEQDEQGHPVLEDVFDPERLKLGADLYQERCAGCHGPTGDGQGEAAPFLSPKPRDYRPGKFKFTSTPFGVKPTRQDLIRTVRHGAKGTSMPAFRWLSDEEMNAVVEYVITLSHRGEVELTLGRIAELDYAEDEPIDEADFQATLAQVRRRWEQAKDQVVQPLTPRPPYDEESIVAGRKAFITRGCSKCHGEDGKGQTEWLDPAFIALQESRPPEERVQINRDDWGQVAPAADLTSGMLHGGRRPIDVYRRIYTGITGAPMPAFAQALSEEPDTFWHLTHYVLSLVEGHEVAFDENQVTDGQTADSAGD